MGVVISVANNKGGVGKSTTVMSLGHAWAKMGKRILFVDLDSQANLTSAISSVPAEERSFIIRDAFIDSKALEIEHVAENIDLIPSGLLLSNFDRDTATLTGREYLLSDLLKPLKDRYDYILIDCPPAVGLIIMNALIASDFLVMVSTPDLFSYQGLIIIANLYREVHMNERLNPGLSLAGVVVNRYQRNNISDMYVDKIRNEMGELFIEPVVPLATKVTQAGSFHQNLYDFDPDGKATRAFLRIAQNLAVRIQDALSEGSN